MSNQMQAWQQQRQPCRHLRHARRRQGGFFLLDIVLGCTMLAIIFSAMLGGAHLYGRGQKKLDNRRAATRLAETVMTDLQRGEQRLPAQGVTITPLNESETSASSDREMAWCEVHAKVNDIEVSLVGRVPGASLRAAQSASAKRIPPTDESDQADTPTQVSASRQLQEVTP